MDIYSLIFIHSSPDTSFALTGTDSVMPRCLTFVLAVVQYHISQTTSSSWNMFICKTIENAKNNIERQLRLLVRLGNGFIEVLSLDLGDLKFESRRLA